MLGVVVSWAGEVTEKVAPDKVNWESTTIEQVEPRVPAPVAVSAVTAKVVEELD